MNNKLIWEMPLASIKCSFVITRKRIDARIEYSPYDLRPVHIKSLSEDPHAKTFVTKESKK